MDASGDNLKGNKNDEQGGLFPVVLLLMQWQAEIWNQTALEVKVDVVGEKETKDNDEKKNENENVSEEKDVQSQTENEVSSEEHNDDGAAEHTHEAREENYKADDTSSAVTRTGRTLGTKNEIKNGTIVASSENVGQTAKNGSSTSPSTTMIQENDPEPLLAT
nr:cilia- and flagella-associated protein 251-like [Tanacetum cinerariifolium]